MNKFLIVILIFFLSISANAQNLPIEKAKELYDKGKKAEAFDLIEKELLSNPDNIELLVLKAELMISEDMFDQTIEVYRQIVKKFPENILYRKRLAQLYLWKEWTMEALFEYEKILQSEPEDLEVLKTTALLYTYVDRNEDALPLFQKIVEIDPTDKEAQLKLYNLLSWTDRMQEALKVLINLTKLDKENIELKRKLAQHYLWMGKEKETIDVLKEVLQHKPDDIEILKQLGKLHEWNNMPFKALSYYERYLELKPWDVEIQERAKTLSIDLGLRKKAIGHLNYLLKIDPTNLSAREQYEQLHESTASNFSTRYRLFADNIGFSHHKVLGKFFSILSDFISFDIYYKFQYFKGKEPLTEVEKSIISQGGGGDLFLKIGNLLSMQFLLSGTNYEKEGSSINGGIKISKEFIFPFSFELYFLREDSLTTISDIQEKIVKNSIGIKFFYSLLKWIFIYSEGGYSRYSDKNNRYFINTGLGFVAFAKPRLEFIYEFEFQSFSEQKPPGYYFSPDKYQVHALGIYFSHNLRDNFFYGLKLRPWYAVNDESLLLTYGVDIGIKPHKKHIFKFEFLRSDTIFGIPVLFYRENLFSSSYTFLF